MTGRGQHPAQTEAAPVPVRHYWQRASTLNVAMLVAGLALVGISFANQRQISRMDERLDARLDEMEAKLQAMPATQVAATIDPSMSEVSTPEPQISAADANPTISALVGVKPVGSKMPDATRVYDFDLSRAPKKGPEDAPITLVEFSDFECSFCRKSQPTLARIQEVYGKRVRLVWKHLPLSLHRNAPRAHIASVAAANQGKFWEFKDALFANPGKLQPDDLKQHAFELGLKMQRFEDDLDDPATKSTIEADMAEAVAIDLTATPGFFINGHYIRGAKPFEDFAEVINEELLKLGFPIPEGAPVKRKPEADQ